MKAGYRRVVHSFWLERERILYATSKDCDAIIVSKYIIRGFSIPRLGKEKRKVMLFFGGGGGNFTSSIE